ncbi:MAG TPA: response regulator [Candidatus Methylomirabilis sp.]|nr:response regulator [Candidatus Methylomirabilis sp.]
MKNEEKKENLVERTILVVEDEPALAEAVSIKLKKEGFKCLLAFSGEEGLQILKKEKPDLIWLDLLMPGMGGFAFLEKVRQQPKWRDLPVVIVSVSGSPEKIRRAFELNVIDYLQKSQYRLGDIVGNVREFLEKRK